MTRKSSYGNTGSVRLLSDIASYARRRGGREVKMVGRHFFAYLNRKGYLRIETDEGRRCLAAERVTPRLHSAQWYRQ